MAYFYLQKKKKVCFSHGSNFRAKSFQGKNFKSQMTKTNA